MKLPIPGDWDGKQWRCVEIQWPDSPYWWALLLGFITTPMRGRFWDEKTGTIASVQAVGQQIYEKNQPWQSCCGDDGSIDDGDGLADEVIRYIYAGSGVESEEDFMGWLCGVNPSAFRIENGVLSVKNFCGEWVEIGPLTSPEDIPPNPIPIEDPVTPYSQCGKASSLINAAAAVMATAIEYADDEADFYSQVVGAYNAQGVKPGRADVYLLQLDVVAVLAVLADSTVLNENLIAKFKCKSWVGMDASTPAGTEDEVAWIYSSIRSVCYDEAIDTISAALLWAAWEQVIQAMGTNDRLTLLSKGCQDFTSECDCPDEPVEASAIFFTGDYIDGTYSGTALEDIEVLNGGRRLKIQMGAAAGNWRECGNIQFMMAGADVGDNVTVRMYPAPGYTDVLTKEWQEYAWGTPAPVSDWNEPVFETITEGDIYFGSGWLEKSTDNGGAETLTVMKWGGRFYPNLGGVEPWRTQIIWEVVAVNGVRLTPIGP